MIKHIASIYGTNQEQSMKRIKYLVLITLAFISFSSFGSAKNPNKLIIEELGYSTATGGFIAYGIGRAINEQNVIYGFIGSLSHVSGKYYGVGNKYYFKNQSGDSWFLNGQLRKKEVYKGKFRDSSMLHLFAGHQWVFGETAGLELQSGTGHSDLSGSYLFPFKMTFSIHF